MCAAFFRLVPEPEGVGEDPGPPISTLPHRPDQVDSESVKKFHNDCIQVDLRVRESVLLRAIASLIPDLLIVSMLCLAASLKFVWNSESLLIHLWLLAVVTAAFVTRKLFNPYHVHPACGSLTVFGDFFSVLHVHGSQSASGNSNVTFLRLP
ncbi:putative transmembrane protein [Gregarina niphandrodes]|uniref:Transmembrane protein n=1 Tax=Gregarina niphandrodes TaxID=110365 RepID=A0A023BCC9_GRENI|nr:putative transmembrane protein [Gregarina niphandrodes]EZG83575.1 putative transmembrane protein [Gregarina niphandrodes]|eukprot:XP_011128936.1 putative transmembrane protein [Gregarina niphandrodes]